MCKLLLLCSFRLTQLFFFCGRFFNISVMKISKKQSNLFKTFKWAAVGAIAADVASIAAGYYYYRQLKNSPDFRYKVYNYDPRLIDVYYRANEKYGDGKARREDFQQWGITKIDSYSFIHLTGL